MFNRFKRNSSSFTESENHLNSSLPDSSHQPVRKRIRLNDFNIADYPGLSVYERIFKMADHIRRTFSQQRKPTPTPLPLETSERRSISLENGINHQNKTHPSCSAFTRNNRKSFVMSSTPFNKYQPNSLTYFPSERQLYGKILSQAATESSQSRTVAAGPLVTIVIDDNDNDSTVNSSRVHGCLKSQISSTKTGQQLIGANDQKALQLKDRLLENGSDALVPTEPNVLVDEEARSWLKVCEQTPFLSDQWLANLTTNYQASAKQRERERQLAECKVRHWEKQRELITQHRMRSLEERLNCLLLTPPVLHDPYLVPQPIPIELPYKPRKVSSLVPPLPVLNETQLAEVDSALRTGALDHVLTEQFNLSVTRKELMTLAGSNWLSDVVVNFYLNLLAARSHQDNNPSTPLPHVAVLNTFFFTKLCSPSGYNGVRRWSRRLNLLDQDLIFIPIHDRGMHWCLASIDLKAKTISYYDSMGSSNDKCLETLRSYLENECYDKKGHPLPDPELWKLVNTQDSVPQQHNGSDCGVFLCTYAEFLSRGAPLTFTQADMPGIRKRMMYEIIRQQLLTTNFKMNGGRTC